MAIQNRDGRVSAARRVRAARAWANMSQPQLAKLLDMSLASLRRVEQESRDVTTAELIHIGEVCSVPRKFMLYGWTEPGKSTAQSQADALEGIIADMTNRIERHERLHALAHDRLAKLDGEVLDEAQDLPDLSDPDLMDTLDTVVKQPAKRKA